jgi:riboflavin synthase
LYEVVQVEKKTGLLTYSVRLSPDLLTNLKIGASVAIDGVCQTVVSIVDKDVCFNAMQETLDRTTIGDLYLGAKVSVERSLCYGDEVGGHNVAGHVIGIGTVIEVKPTDNNLCLIIQCPKDWMKYILTKGFIAVDGSSLTVGQVYPAEGTFSLYLIPETLRLTNFGNKKVGNRVNIELDHNTQTIVTAVERVLAQMKGF